MSLRSFMSTSLLMGLTACTAPLILPQQQASSAAIPTQQTVTIPFKALVNQAPFSCQKTYSAVGTSRSVLTPRDFRFYVSQIHLKNQAGEYVPLQLKQDGKWQHQNLALLDFEDKTGSCEGNAETHMDITGTVPAGTYKGLKFELGVPFAMNHQDVNLAPSPLNLTSLFWVWRTGYKFARLDFASTGQPQGYFVHLGSTGCTGTATMPMHVAHDDHSGGTTTESTTSAPLNCEKPNRASIQLDDFQFKQHSVTADLGTLMTNNNIDENQANTAVGCMSAPDDSDCKGIFNHLGLNVGTKQDFFGLVSEKP